MPIAPAPDPPFHNYPHRFPKSRQRARQLAHRITDVTRQAPKSRPAVVVDTSYQMSQGYVLCQLNSSIVQVYSVPYGQVLRGMQLYCRQQGTISTIQRYIFDGFAPNVSMLGVSGSVIYNKVLAPGNIGGPSTPTPPIATATSGMPTASGLSGATGYYWHLFFYLPALPSTTATLFQMVQYGGSNKLALEYLPDGTLQFRDQANYGYTLMGAIPHSVHWLLIQPGTTYAMLLDGNTSLGYSIVGGVPSFTANGATYTGSWLANTDNSSPAPLGSWVSKLGYGVSWSGSSPIPLLQTVPAADSAIPKLNSGTFVKTFNRYLVSDSSGTTLTNTGQTGSNATIFASTSAIQVPGPY